MNQQALMQRAVELSLRGLGKTAPNPIVGAVIADSKGEIVSEGFHQGREHAEVIALNNLSVATDDLTLFVTLEPCSHHGKTPPCTDAIIDSGIRRVVFATKDPNPIAQGGESLLRKAGIDTTHLPYREASFANRAWLTKISLGRPRFLWKVATSLDGAISAQDGSSKWITNELSRNDAKKERSFADAILTGTGTVLADDPSMLGSEKNPLRIVMGNREIPPHSKILSSDAETISIKSHSFDPLLDLVRERGINQVFVESGSRLGTALLRAGLIDEILLYQAPTILASDHRFSMGLDIPDISGQLRLSSEALLEFDGDIKRLLFVHAESDQSRLNKELSCSPA